MAKNIEPSLKKISQYLKLESDKNVKFVVPEYQRAYSWTIVECDKLFQDISDFIANGSDDPYFFGTIIIDCSDSDKTGSFNLIDGQQRTTTFFLLLKALQLQLNEAILKFLKNEESENLLEVLKSYRNKVLEILFKADVEKVYEILKDWSESKSIKVLENRSINEQHKSEFQVIISSKTFDEAEKDVYKIPRKQKNNKFTNYFRNFKFFYDKLSSYSESGLYAFAKSFLDKCQVIEIRSWQVEQAITMFNSLNSTGMVLSNADIISAQLYSNAGDKIERFNDSWRSIVKLSEELSSRNIIEIDSVLQQYMYICRARLKEYVKGNSIDVTTPGLRKYFTVEKKDDLKDPLFICDNLFKIVRIWERIKDFPVIKLSLRFNENMKLFLISFVFRYDLEDITENKIIEIVECLLRLFTLLELVESGYSNQKFKTFLFKENVKLVDNNVSSTDIKNDFDEHIRKNWVDEDVKQLVCEYERNVLVFLNEYLFAKEQGEKFYLTDTVNVEHIMPASGKNKSVIQEDAGIKSKEEFDQLVNRIGNKIPLEEGINKTMGNEWFKTKKQYSIKEKTGYKDSNYCLAKSLTKYRSDCWTRDDIKNATEKAADRIVKFIFDK